MAHAADGCDEALLPHARAATRNRPSTSGRSFAAVASAALTVGGIASLAAFAGTSLGHPSARASLGSARDGDSALRVPSAHRGGTKPPVFVVSSVDSGTDAAFDAFKRDVLLDALRAPPDFAERASWAGAASATHLPEKIERYEEACDVFEHGLATLTGTYVGQTHLWSDGGSPFFELDQGKKMTVTKEVARHSKVLAPALTTANDLLNLGSSSSSSDDTEEDEISEVEKKAVGDAVGGAVSHLLAWRRARSAAKDHEENEKLSKDVLSTPGGGAVVMDVGFFRPGGGEKALVGASWTSALDAVTAYRPRDADVVFLDVDADSIGDAPPTQTLKIGGDVHSSVSFHRHDGSVSSSSSSSRSPPLNPAMYFVTEKFLQKAFQEVNAKGFGFVAEFLREKCAANVFKCYATTPRFAERRGDDVANNHE